MKQSIINGMNIVTKALWFGLYAIRLIENLQRNFRKLVLILLDSINFCQKIIYCSKLWKCKSSL